MFLAADAHPAASHDWEIVINSVIKIFVYFDFDKQEESTDVVTIWIWLAQTLNKTILEIHFFSVFKVFDRCVPCCSL